MRSNIVMRYAHRAKDNIINTQSKEHSQFLIKKKEHSQLPIYPSSGPRSLGASDD
jgi:hypothetical protein